jgi:hypothetical protein
MLVSPDTSPYVIVLQVAGTVMAHDLRIFRLKNFRNNQDELRQHIFDSVLGSNPDQTGYADASFTFIIP